MNNKRKCPAGWAGQGQDESPVGDDLPVLYHSELRNASVVHLIDQARRLQRHHLDLSQRHGRIRAALQRLVA